jgi:hypothetical protein
MKFILLHYDEILTCTFLFSYKDITHQGHNQSSSIDVNQYKEGRILKLPQ